MAVKLLGTHIAKTRECSEEIMVEFDILIQSS